MRLALVIEGSIRVSPSCLSTAQSAELTKAVDAALATYDYMGALAICYSALEKDQSNIAALYGQARTYLKLMRIDDAARCFGMIYFINPDSIELLCSEKSFLKDPVFQSYKTVVRDFIDDDPDFQAESLSSVESFELVVQNFIDNNRAFKQKTIRRSLAASMHVLRDPSKQIQKKFSSTVINETIDSELMADGILPELVLSWNEKKNIDSLCSFYKKAHNKYKSQAFFSYRLAQLYYEKSDYQNALRSCKKFLNAKSGYSPESVLMGKILCAMGEYSQATEHFQALFRSKPGLYKLDYLCGLGLIFWELGNYSEAIKSYEEALKINPNCEEALMGLVLIYTVVADYENAELYFERKKLGSSSLSLSSILIPIMDDEYVTPIFKILSTDERYSINRRLIVCQTGYTHLMENDLEVAFPNFQEALRNNQNDFLALHGMAEILSAIGEYHAAEYLFNKIRGIFKKNTGALKLKLSVSSCFAEARLYEYRGQYQKALDAIQEIVSLFEAYPTLEKDAEPSKRVQHYNNRNNSREFVRRLHMDEVLLRSGNKDAAPYHLILEPFFSLNARDTMIRYQIARIFSYKRVFRELPYLIREKSDAKLSNFTSSLVNKLLISPEVLKKTGSDFSNFLSSSEIEEIIIKFCQKESLGEDEVIRYLTLMARGIGCLYLRDDLDFLDKIDRNAEDLWKYLDSFFFNSPKTQLALVWCAWGDIFTVMGGLKQAECLYELAAHITKTDANTVPTEKLKIFFNSLRDYEHKPEENVFQYAASRLPIVKFHRACKNGDVDELPILLTSLKKEKSDIRVCSLDGYTAWEFAIEGNQPKILDCLLDQKFKFDETQIKALYDFAKKFAHVKLALFALDEMQPKWKDLSCYMARLFFEKLISKMITRPDEKKPLEGTLFPLLRLALHNNSNLQIFIKSLKMAEDNPNKVESFDKSDYLTHMLFTWIARKTYQHPSWGLFWSRVERKANDYKEMLVFLDQCIDLGYIQWHETLNDEVKRQIGTPAIPAKKPMEFPAPSPTQTAAAETRPAEKAPSSPAKRERTFPTVPTESLKKLFTLMQEFDLETMLDNTQKKAGTTKPSEKNTLKDVLLKKVIPNQSDPAYEFIRANWDTSHLISLFKTTFFKTNIVRAFGSFLWNRDFSEFTQQALGTWNEDLEAIRALKAYFNEFYVSQENTSSIDYKHLIICLLRDKNLRAFLNVEENIVFLCTLIEKLAIPYLSQEVARKIFSILNDIQAEIQENYYEKILDYDSCSTLLGSAEKFIPLARGLLDIFEKLSHIIKIFIEPHLTPMHLLMFPTVDAIFKQASAEREKPTTNTQGQALYINMKHLFDERVPKEKLGLFLHTPLGDRLRAKKLDEMEFVSSAASPISFKRCQFQGFSFKNCRFENINFSNTYFEQCDFTGSIFIGELDFSSASLDFETAKTLLPALSESLNSAMHKPKLVIGNRILVRPHETQEKIKILGELATYIDGIDSEIILPHQSKHCFPLPQTRAASDNQTKTDSLNEEEILDEDSSFQLFELVSGISDCFSNHMDSVLTTSMNLLSKIEEAPAMAVEAIIGSDDVEYASEAECFSAIKKQLHDLEERNEELNKQIKAHYSDNVATSNDLSKEMDLLKQEQKSTQEALNLLSQAFGPIQDNWNYKHKSRNEIKVLCKNPSVGLFYQTFLSQLDAALISLFILQSRLDLIETRRGTILNLASKADNKTAATLQIGTSMGKAAHKASSILATAAAQGPQFIDKAAALVSKVGHGCQVILPQLNNVSQALQTVAGAVPVIGAATGILNKIGDTIVDYYDKKKAHDTDTFFGGMTTKTLEKLSLWTAGKITSSFIEIIQGLEEKSAKYLAHYCVKVMIVMILNNKLDSEYDFILEVLMSFRKSLRRDLSEIFLPFLNPKMCDAEEKKLGFSEQEICEFSGICYQDPTDDKLFHRYCIIPKTLRNDKQLLKYKSNANKIGFVRIDSRDLENVKRYLESKEMKLSAMDVASNEEASSPQKNSSAAAVSATTHADDDPSSSVVQLLAVQLKHMEDKVTNLTAELSASKAKYEKLEAEQAKQNVRQEKQQQAFRALAEPIITVKAASNQALDTEKQVIKKQAANLRKLNNSDPTLFSGISISRRDDSPPPPVGQSTPDVPKSTQPANTSDKSDDGPDLTRKHESFAKK